MSTKVKEKPILATFLIAIIIGLVCLIIFVLNYYQPQLELPPKLILTNANGEETELLLTSYTWNYKGETKTYDAGIKDDKFLNYDFDTKNICFDSLYNVVMKNLVNIQTVPKYKCNGLIENCYVYSGYDEKPGIHTGSIVVGTATKFKPTVQYGTNYIELTLNSDQGVATYIFKFIDLRNVNLDRLKIGKLSTNAENIQEYLKTCDYARFLNNVKVENNKIIIDYDYWIGKEVTSEFALVLFTALDEVDEIEFNFLYDKYAKSEWNIETQKDDITTFDKVEPHRYIRDGFETSERVSIKELKEYLNR